MSAKIDVNKLQKSLSTKHFGRTILLSHEVDSTNKRAKELAVHGAREGIVVIAETQTKGRGRHGREWISPTGGLWFSLVLRPKLCPAATSKLNFVAGLAVAEVLSGMFDLKVEVKWPNDVLVNGRKICGVISEMKTTDETINFVVVGVGVNVNFNVKDVFPRRLREAVTSLEDELGRRIQLEGLFKTLLEKMESLYEQFIKKGFGFILGRWKNYADFLGHEVEVTNLTGKIRGLALDVDNDGALILKLEDGTTKHVLVGDVFLQPK